MVTWLSLRLVQSYWTKATRLINSQGERGRKGPMQYIACLHMPRDTPLRGQYLHKFPYLLNHELFNELIMINELTTQSPHLWILGTKTSTQKLLTLFTSKPKQWEYDWLSPEKSKQLHHLLDFQPLSYKQRKPHLELPTYSGSSPLFIRSTLTVQPARSWLSPLGNHHDWSQLSPCVTEGD